MRYQYDYAVFNISKIQIESNSQHRRPQSSRWTSCVQYFKDTNREQFTTIGIITIPYIKLCSIFQRYKSRAIHNDPELEIKINGAVFNISKIQIESNSQRIRAIVEITTSCVQYFKDTNREQFTTIRQ